MLGASHAVLLGAGAACHALPQSYQERVDRLNPISHWPLVTLADRKGISDVVASGLHETGLPPIAQLDDGGASRGFNGVDAYGTIEHQAAYAVPAGGVFVLMQPDTVGAKMQVFNSGTSLPGSMALEMEPGGQPRAYRFRSDGTAIVITGAVGQIAAGTPYLYGVTWGPSGLRLWLMDEDLQPGLVASNPETDWATITDTATKYLGRWSGSAIDHFDGVLGHLQFYGTELKQAQIESVALPQLVVWLGDFDAGSVAANGGTFIDFAPFAHPASGYTPAVVSQPSLGIATAVGTGAEYDAGGTTGNDDTFTAKIAASGLDSRTATITIDVTAQLQLAYTVPVAPSAPSGTTIYVATTGSDTTGNGSLGTPYRTIAKALSVAVNGNTIILRKGIYRGEANLNVSASNLTIKGYRNDIMADPLDPANWPIIDGSFHPANVSWELVDAGRQEYRTTATNLGTGTPQGMIVPGLVHQLPRWEPLGGYKNPTPMYRLWPYQGTSGVRSLVAFRQTGSVTPGDRECYLGPGTYRMSDGRIHIRLQPIHPSVNGGEPLDGVPDKHPDNNQIFLWQKDNELFASLSNGFRMEGVFVRGYDRFYHNGAGRSNIQLIRCVFWVGAFQNYWFLTTSATTGLLVQHCIIEGGHCLWWPFRLIKTNLPNGGSNYGRINAFNFNSGGLHSATIEDNIYTGITDAFVATSSSCDAASVLTIRNNCMFIAQDMEQVSSSWNRREVAYNFIKGPLASNQGPGNNAPPGVANGCKYHHNICVWNHLQIEEPGERKAWEITVTHQSATAWRSYTYHNTIIFANPAENGSRASRMERPLLGYSTPNGPHETWNNIFVLYNRHPPGGDPTSIRYLHEEMHTNEPTKQWLTDGNGYFVVKDPTVGADSLFADVRNVAGGAPVTFNSLAQFRSHPYYTASIGNYGYGAGMETNSVQGDPDFVGEVEKTDVLAHPPGHYRPQASNYRNGAVNIAGRGLPGADVHQPWRGALDPDGDGSEVGPRQAAV